MKDIIKYKKIEITNIGINIKEDLLEKEWFEIFN